jgi:hypothetical protein
MRAAILTGIAKAMNIPSTRSIANIDPNDAAG